MLQVRARGHVDTRILDGERHRRIRTRRGRELSLTVICVLMITAAIACQPVFEHWQVINLSNELIIVFIDRDAHEVLEPQQQSDIPGEPCPCPRSESRLAGKRYVISAYEFVLGEGEYGGHITSRPEFQLGSPGRLVYCRVFTRPELASLGFVITIPANHRLPEGAPSASETCV